MKSHDQMEMTKIFYKLFIFTLDRKLYIFKFNDISVTFKVIRGQSSRVIWNQSSRCHSVYIIISLNVAHRSDQTSHMQKLAQTEIKDCWNVFSKWDVIAF